MKTIKKSTLFIVLISILTSCKKEVQIDLQSRESQIVIEADFSAARRVNTVHITRTQSIYQTESFPEITKAYVVVTDNAEYREVLTETQPGIYQTSAFSGKAGTKYFLTVVYDNKTYEAESTLPPLVKLDTSLVINSDYGNIKMVGFIPVYTDPAGIKNNYRFVQSVNGKRLKGSIVKNDEYSDGLLQQEPFYLMDVELKPGDCLEVEMQMIDDSSYLYFSSKDKTSSMESAAPANPVTNIRGGALGYFSVHNTQRAKMVIGK